MLRLTIMPLITDFGETIEAAVKFGSPLNPKIRLTFARDYQIFDQFANFPDKESCGSVVRPRELPAKIKVRVIKEDRVAKVKTDVYGGAITFATAGELKLITLPNDTDPVNKGIKAFIDALPPETEIILMWE